jgi:membrane-associated protease RseP (regulator of RpoE activity)
VELGEGFTLQGLVRTRRPGTPVGGAVVTLFTDDGPRTTRTASSGEFTVGELSPGPARLRVRAPGFATLLVNAEVADGRPVRPQRLPAVELEEEAVVSGVVVDDRGQPVPGARVARDGAPTFLLAGAPPPEVALADGQGRFRLGGLPAGSVTLEAYAPDHGRARLDAELRAGRPRTDLRIVLPAVGPNPGAANGNVAPGNVGVTLGETGEPRAVVLVAVEEGSEAARAGLAPGDVVLEVDGTSVTTLEEARARLGGALGTDVLVVFARGEAKRAVRIPREAVRR